MKHAPTPYRVERWSGNGGQRGISILDADGHNIATPVMDLRDREMATAQFLVRAANERAGLLRHARTLLELILDADTREYTEAEGEALRWLEHYTGDAA